MCGIAGILDASLTHESTAIDQMVAVLAHRGPNAQQSVRLEGCHLGHARLSVIDLASGSQPMRSADGRCYIVFNGEIYNFKELRRELTSRGARFLTSSDTEVVLAAYEAWGPGCLDKFRGMFAFAIWTPAERALFAARDPFGEKPFFYSHDGTGLRFASELKAFERIGACRELDLRAVDAYLALGYVPPDMCIWSSIQALAPAHYLTWERGKLDVVRYWVPRFGERSIDLDDAAGRVRDLLATAVNRQLVSDVPLGAFLSGGKDSCSVVALMSQHSAAPVKTFSVGFGQEINELAEARVVARRYGTEHHEIDLGEIQAADLLVRMADVYDQPLADSSAIPTYLICGYAKQHVTVVLSGDGGDELFGGYSWYNAMALSQHLTSSLAQWFVWRLASKLMLDRNRLLRRRAVAMGLAVRWSDVWQQAVMSHTYVRMNERRKLLQQPGSHWPGDLYSPPAAATGLDRAFYFDVTSYLPGDLLVKVDRASMAHGLECRAPFLDRDLAEFAFSLPASLKVTERQNKIALEAAVRDRWPDQIAQRPKQGFGAPYGSWLQQSAVRDLMRTVCGRSSRLRQLLPGLAAGTIAANDYRAWLLLTLGLWLDRRYSHNAVNVSHE
jgi:asparagine synthase (glutamine-hydrolysing)